MMPYKSAGARIWPWEMTVTVSLLGPLEPIAYLWRRPWAICSVRVRSCDFVSELEGSAASMCRILESSAAVWSESGGLGVSRLLLG